MASAEAASDDLRCISEHFNLSWIGDTENLSSKVLERSVTFFKESYIYNIELFPEAAGERDGDAASALPRGERDLNIL